MTYGTVGDRSSKTMCASFRSRRSRALAIEIESESESESVSVSLWSRRVSNRRPCRVGCMHYQLNKTGQKMISGSSAGKRYSMSFSCCCLVLLICWGFKMRPP